jgi:serine protease Do
MAVTHSRFSRSRLFSALAMGCLLAAQAPDASADEPVSFEHAARSLQEATVTLRVTSPPNSKGEPSPSEPQRVAVFTGALVGRGLIVTALCDAAASMRVTLPDGEQAVAAPRVLDEFSGLGLFEVAPAPATELKIAAEAPEVGGWVICGSGWGAERAVVSLGVVSGVDRTIAGANYPPLLQCDFRTTETSCGAPIVNRSAELVAVLVAAEEGARGRGWAYAAPARHVSRLLEVNAAGQDGADSADRVVVLKRERPIVGMELDGQPDEIRVTRVMNGSPAEKAGLRVGDRILAADGVKIRSVYQAVRPTLYKQPGDKMTYLVQQGDEFRTIEVVLGGGIALPANSIPNFFEPKLVVGDPLQRATKIEELEDVIVSQRRQLDAQQQQQQRTAEELKELKQELEKLRKQSPEG